MNDSDLTIPRELKGAQQGGSSDDRPGGGAEGYTSSATASSSSSTNNPRHRRKVCYLVQMQSSGHQAQQCTLSTSCSQHHKYKKNSKACFFPHCNLSLSRMYFPQSVYSSPVAVTCSPVLIFPFFQKLFNFLIVVDCCLYRHVPDLISVSDSLYLISYSISLSNLIS